MPQTRSAFNPHRLTVEWEWALWEEIVFPNKTTD